MQKKSPKIRNVIVAVNLADASWRDFLTGLFDFARTGVHWNIRLIQSSGELSEAIRDRDVLSRTHGVVAGIRADAATVDVLNETKVPLVLVGMEDERLAQRAGTAVIRHDNEDIGSFAAKHFLSLGNFNSFGFVTTQDNPPWARLRACGYRRALEANGHTPHFFKSPFRSGSEEDLRRLRRWTRELPKPAAVFVAYDRRAIDVLAACKEASIPVSGQIAVIGVDNDRLLCDFADPPLSSIAPNHEEEGRVAAQTLDAMMRGRLRKRQSTILITGKEIVERESARQATPATVLLRRATGYIVRNAAKSIKVSDVTRHLGVSRSLLDLRFRETTGATTAALITETRLAEVKRRLRKTKQSIRGISRECGFSNPNHLKNLFKRHFGISMRDWRKRHAAHD